MCVFTSIQNIGRSIPLKTQLDIKFLLPFSSSRKWLKNLEERNYDIFCLMNTHKYFDRET